MCAWVCLECRSTCMLLEVYHISLQTFLDRQEKLQESREVLSMLKANVSFQPQSLAVRDCESPLAERGTSPMWRWIWCVTADVSPVCRAFPARALHSGRSVPSSLGSCL